MWEAMLGTVLGVVIVFGLFFGMISLLSHIKATKTAAETKVLENEKRIEQVQRNHEVDKLVGKITAYMIHVMEVYSHVFDALPNDDERYEYILNHHYFDYSNLNEEMVKRAYKSAYNTYVQKTNKKYLGKGSTDIVPHNTSILSYFEEKVPQKFD